MSPSTPGCSRRCSGATRKVSANHANIANHDPRIEGRLRRAARPLKKINDDARRPPPALRFCDDSRIRGDRLFPLRSSSISEIEHLLVLFVGLFSL